MSPIQIELKNISHCYDGHHAIDQISLSIKDGELIAILGPSGCGKTTLLRLIAGLLPIQQGQIYFNQKEVNLLSPQKRNTAMVFQNYALFPHMTVEENISYGLRVRKMSATLRKERVHQIMSKVELTHLNDRKIHELSGGQQQRVALARALVVNPDVLLFDEPLSNLDEKLRVSMRNEIRAIQKDLQVTSLYVTHDQEEAMAIADRIMIMNDGKIQQIGKPQEVYENPVNQFVASFMGECNFFTDGDQLTMCRPEVIELSPNGEEEGVVTWSEYVGSIQRITVLWNEQQLVIEAFTKQLKCYPFQIGDTVRFHLNKNDHIRILP